MRDVWGRDVGMHDPGCATSDARPPDARSLIGILGIDGPRVVKRREALWPRCMWNSHAEERSAAFLAGDVDLASMLRNDPTPSGQARALPMGLVVKNGSKILERTSAGMPSPVSCTVRIAPNPRPNLSS